MTPRPPRAEARSLTRRCGVLLEFPRRRNRISETSSQSTAPSSGESCKPSVPLAQRRSRRRRHGTAPVRSQGPQGNRWRRDEISVRRAGWQAPRAGGPRPGPERNRLRPSPGFALINACPRFPILHNAEETICRPYKAAQLRHPLRTLGADAGYLTQAGGLLLDALPGSRISEIVRLPRVAPN
jgi:hypothetical protein